MNPSLLPLLPAVDDILFNFAQSDGFWANWSTAFGTSYDVVKATELQHPHFSQRKRMECLKALPSIDLNPILAQLPQRQCVVRI